MQNWSEMKYNQELKVFFNAEITFGLLQLCVGANKLFWAQRNL